MARWDGSGRCVRVEGGAVRASLHHKAKPDVIKGPFRKRGGCAMKVVGLTRGGLCGCPGMPGRAWRVRRVGRDGGAREGAARGAISRGRSTGGIAVAGKDRREAEAQDARARGMDVERSQPRKGLGGEGRRVKPEGPRSERSPSPAPGDTVPHPAAASLWEQFVSQNLAVALRRVEHNAGAAGIDGMSTKELRPWLKDHWPKVRSRLDAGTYRRARPEGDDPQALGWPANVGGAGCGGSVDLPGHRAGAHAHLRPAFPSSQLRLWPGARPIMRSSGHASSSLMTRRGASTLISTRSSIEFSTTP